MKPGTEETMIDKTAWDAWKVTPQEEWKIVLSAGSLYINYRIAARRFAMSADTVPDFLLGPLSGVDSSRHHAGVEQVFKLLHPSRGGAGLQACDKLL